MTNTPHDKPPTMQGWIVKIGAGAYAGADFRIIDWIDHGALVPDTDMLVAYETDRQVQGHPDDNNVMLGWISPSVAILKHMNDLDLEQSRSKAPSTTGYVG